MAEFVWSTDSTGFTLWKRYEENGETVERPIYNQQQQARWFTKDIRSESEEEELSDDFLECLAQLRNEIHAFTEENRDEAEAIAEYRKQLHQELEFKEKKIVSEILFYFGKPNLTPTDEMAELLNYAGRKSNLDITDLEGDVEDREPDELLDRFQQSAEDAVEGRTSDVDQLEEAEGDNSGE